MATLAGQKIKDKYGNLLQVEGGVTSSLKGVEDGTGDTTALKVSTTEAQVDGTLSFTAAPSTDNNESTALFINASNEVVQRELASTAFSEDVAPFPESVVGYVEGDIPLTGSPQPLVFAAANNNTESTSYHFGQAPADFLFDPVAGTIENRSDEAFPVRVSITSSFEVASPASITYELQRATGAGAFTTVKRVIRDKGSAGPNQADSFWGLFVLEPTQKIRVVVSLTSGAATIKPGTELEVIKKEAGNII